VLGGAVADLRESFRTYYDEIDRCLARQCYWSLVYLLVVLPAVCAAMETANGEATGNDYKNWCRRYFERGARLTDVDRYGIRVALVHQGRTTVEELGQYQSYSFAPPGSGEHLTVRDLGAGGKKLIVNVGQLADETKRAMEKWLSDQGNARRPNIARHLPLLAREGRAEIVGPREIIWHLPVTSSTGGM
jgi:hypothetical protein